MEYIEDITALVVDDSEFFASLTADQLETKHGIDARTASSPETALDELGSLDVDVIVSDYDMPEMDGLAFYDRVTDVAPDVPFILLTGRTDGDIASEAISAGIDDYLQKEAVAERNDFQVLANRVQNVVSRRKSREKYELVVDNTPEGIAQVSRDGTIMAANDTVAESFDASSGDIVGESVDDVLPAEIANRWLAYGDDALATGERVSFESKYGDRYFHTFAVPVDVGGETDTFQIISRDITERREREEELEARTEQLELITRFVRHDIRNDIDLIYSWSELLGDHVDDEGQEYVDRITSTTDHITELTQIAGEFVETVSSGSDAELKAIELRHTLGEELEKVRSSYEEATVQLNGDIPAVDVRANGMLSSVFRNLLNNAVQHNTAANPAVYVTATVDDGLATVTIADNGPGIPDDQKSDIFGKGDQGADSSGTGIGLYLVHTLVSQYGGHVTVEDSDIGGARFVVELPTM
jgi:PAS domain S-box-containing protein